MTAKPLSWHYRDGTLSVAWGEGVAEIGGEFAETAVNRLAQIGSDAGNVQLFLAGLFVCAAAVDGGLVTFRGSYVDCEVSVQLTKAGSRHG